MDLTEFLLARIAEDEAVARAAAKDAESPHWFDEPPPPDRNWDLHNLLTGPTEHGAGNYLETDIDGSVAAHIARHDPARVLAECEAKRRIVEALARAGEGQYGGYGAAIEYAQEIVLGSLALPYADHPDYRDEWKP